MESNYENKMMSPCKFTTAKYPCGCKYEFNYPPPDDCPIHGTFLRVYYACGCFKDYQGDIEPPVRCYKHGAFIESTNLVPSYE